MGSIALYYSPTCGYCRKVLRFIEQNQIIVTLKNVNASAEIRQELLALAGKSQVPCLIVDGTSLHESDDIITWLAEHGRSNDYEGN